MNWHKILPLEVNHPNCKTIYSNSQWMIIFYLVNLYACQCGNHQEQIKHIKLHDLSSVETSISQLGVSQIIEYSLICPDTIPFYIEDKVCITENYIFIQDKLTGTILAFNKDGNFNSVLYSQQEKLIAKLAKIRGDCKGFAILDYSVKNIRFYNELLQQVTVSRLNPYCLEIAILPDLSYYSYFPDITSIQNNGFSFQYVSNTNNKECFLKSYGQKNGFIKFYSVQFLGDILVYWAYDRNRIYHISPDNSVDAEYMLDLGKDRLIFKDIKTSLDLYSKSLTSLSVTRLLESKNHIFFETVNNGLVEFLIYDKMVKRSWGIKFPDGYSSPGIVDDLNDGIPFVPEGVDFRGNFFSFILPQELMEKKQEKSRTKPIGVLRICDYEKG